VPARAFAPDTPPRPLPEWEREVVSALMPAHDRDGLRVHSHCQCGCASISFVPRLSHHALLAEAETDDTDGVPIWLLLFGSRDRNMLDELKIQRADGTALRALPDPRSLTPKMH
jgi:hypothetical protein